MSKALTAHPDLVAIELVDSGIRFRSYGGGPESDRQAQPDSGPADIVGLALLTPEGVITGEAARRRAWLEPQRSFDQYWHQLNLSPLPASSRHARHHADLAFAQLDAIHRAAGQPQKVVFAVPGSFSREQLSILLGLANALPFTTAGLVDSAVAAVSQVVIPGAGSGTARRRIRHLDIQLHQCLITSLEVSDQVERQAVAPVSGAGLRHFHDTWSQYIANLFIQEYRYDPLHTAEGEQQLRDNLPRWLMQLAGSPEVQIELTTARGNFQLKLRRNDLLAATAARTASLTRALADCGKADAVFLSHRLAALPEMAAMLGGVPLPADACLNACLSRLDEICPTTEAIQFVTRLSAKPGPGVSTGLSRSPSTALKSSGENRSEPPTHLLCGHRAWPLATGLGLRLVNGELQVSGDLTAPVTLRRSGGVLRLLGDDPRIAADRPDALSSGDHIRYGDQVLILIREQAPHRDRTTGEPERD